MLNRLIVGALGIASCALTSAEYLHQETVVVISRHGIRVPFPELSGLPEDVFSKDDNHSWFTNLSDWGTDEDAGLTAHGEDVLYEMGVHFQNEVLKNSSARFTIYSPLVSRDIKSAINFFRGAFPEANVTQESMYGPGDKIQQHYMELLENMGGVEVEGCVASAALPKVLAGEIGGDFAAVSTANKEAILSLNSHLNCCKPDLCIQEGDSNSGDNCTLMNLPTKWEGQSKFWEDFTGPLTFAGKLMERLQLMYLNGMPWNELVPQMTVDQLSALMRLHQESVSIASDYWTAVEAGSELLVHLAATMQQIVQDSEVEGLQSSKHDSLVYYALHDVNIYFIRRLLRLNWLTKSYNPNQCPPGAMLLFVLYSSTQTSPQGVTEKKYYVKAFFMTQSMKQQREVSKLSTADPASHVFVIMPGCAHGPELSCPFEDFKHLVLKEIKRDCVQLVDPDVLAKGSLKRSLTSESII